MTQPKYRRARNAMTRVIAVGVLGAITMTAWYCADAIGRSTNTPMFSTLGAMKQFVER
jgi:hypothetical protein